ncbi:uncharacterized protein LOC132723027 [Ruditapes philippinarum]|uniref:uncharacterized protein LOC132723027 n=1 Tax=Ruditapes philippinarum TaxID=129788 RepID=UPI00295B8F07|nr:uncharacterized protein LOC132723027 [Ruditapes philippinarum]
MLYEGLYVEGLINASNASHCVLEAPTDKGNKNGIEKKSQQNRGQSKLMAKNGNPTEQNTVLDDVLDTNDKLERQIKQLQNEIKHQQNEIKDQQLIIKKFQERSKTAEKRSSEITKHMAKVMDTSGAFESTNDSLSKINIITQFSNVYSNDWAKLSIWLAKQGILEDQIIQSLTSLMKESYQECLCLADEQLRQFMLLSESQGSPSHEEHEELYALRRKYAIKDTARARISQEVLEKVFIGKEIPWFQIEDKTEEAKKMLQEFLHKFVDCCWVMVVSTPRLALNFDVVGKQYCKEHFKVYSAKERIKDETKDTNSVYEVVWPCVYYADGSVFCTKGDALLVSIGSTPVEDSGIVDCTCFVSKEDKGNRTAVDENSSVNKKVTDV